MAGSGDMDFDASLRYDMADFRIDLIERDGTVSSTTTQRWSFAGLDPAELLTGRPGLTQILTSAKAAVFDSPEAATLGVELAGCIPALLGSNRAQISSALSLVEDCAASPQRELRVTRVATGPAH